MAFDVTLSIHRIQELWMEIPGVRAAPDEPPEQLDPFPIAITFERYGEMDNSQMHSGSFASLKGTIWSELHIKRASLPLAVKSAMSFRDAFLKKLQSDPNLDSFLMLVMTIRWTFLPMEWAGIQTIGYRFELDYQTEIQPD